MLEWTRWYCADVVPWTWRVSQTSAIVAFLEESTSDLLSSHILAPHSRQLYSDVEVFHQHCFSVSCNTLQHVNVQKDESTKKKISILVAVSCPYITIFSLATLLTSLRN
jgi:hypothetical protein